MTTKRKPARRYEIRYEAVEYLPRTAIEVWPEFRRVRAAINDVLRILSLLKRIKNGTLVSARFTLLNCYRDLPDDSPLELVASEIGRLSYVMADALTILSDLKHCRIHHLEEARFKLTYGQTPKKRDPGYGSGTKNDRKTFDSSDSDDAGETDIDADGSAD